MGTRNYTRQFPPQPRVIDNGWGPNYPVGMTNLELVEYAPNGLFAGSTMYDLYRTNGGMGSGMVDSFAYDPITQYGALSSNVAEGGGNSDSSLWFLMMNHQPPFNRYPFTSVENSMSRGSESKYFENSQSKKSPQMGIAEKTGTGWFESLNQESRLLPTAVVSSNTVSGKGSTTTTSPANPSGKTVTCPPGTKLIGGKCIKQTAVISQTPIQRPPISIRCAPGFTAVNGVCQPVSIQPVAVVPVGGPVGGSMIGGGGGGGSAAGEESTDQQGEGEGAGRAVDCKTNYLAVLIGAALGAGIAFLIAKKYGKNIKKSSIIGALIGALLGLAYAIHQCRPIGIMSKIGIKSKVAAAPAAPASGQSSYCGACGA